MTTMSSAEQLQLEMINRARMDPDAEAALLSQEIKRPFDLNEGLTAGTISSASKQVLAGNNTLTTVAEGHTNVLLSSKVFEDDPNNARNPHTGIGDGTEGERIANAGYQETYPPGQFYHDENVGWAGTGGTIDAAALQGLNETIYNGLFVDAKVDSKGHRLAIMDDNMREIGIGETTGQVTPHGSTQPLNAALVTEDFGVSGSNSFLTGAVYNDANHDNFYSLGEGVQGVTATVTTTGGALVGSDTTGSGGGWSVAEPGGTYNVTFSGGGLAAAVAATVEGGNRNAKLDLVNGNEIFANANTTLGAGAKELHILGMDNVNGTGNALDNVIVGNKGNNVLIGGGGNDTIDGGAGDDTAVYSGSLSQYQVTVLSSTSVMLKDLRAGSPDGTDTITNVEHFRFADQTVNFSDLHTTAPPASAGSIAINDVSITEGDAGTKLAIFTVTRSGGTAAFDVNFATQDGTATTADGDYIAKAGTLHFDANVNTQTISVTINGDTKVEADETFKVLLSGATNGATIGHGQGIGTIVNDDVAVNHAPVVTGHNVSVDAKGSVAASSLFTAHDQDGDNTITQYGFWDSGSGGHFTVNGVAQATGQWILVDAGHLGSVNYVGAAAGGSETLYVSASDGKAWADVASLTATTLPPPVNHAPVVAASDVSATHNQSFAASSLFSVSDVDHDTITKYQVADSYGTGHWVLNGTSKPAGTWIDVAASDLAHLSFQTGSGSDLLWARAYDGTVWSDWKSFTVNAPADHAPVVAASDVSPTHFQTSLAFSSLFSVTDADGDAITKYQFADANASAASGHLVINGVAQDAGKWIDVNASQVANTSFQLGSEGDYVYVRAYDGLAWSDWKGFTINAPVNHAPVVTGHNVSVDANGSVAASSLLTAHDQDGDNTITQYGFWDGGSGGGHFTVNGVAQATGQWILVDAGHLGSVSYVGAPSGGSETLYVSAFDGKAWANVASLTATTLPHAAEDFNGDGKSDVLWTKADGSVAMWQMDGNKIVSNQTVGSVGTSWHAAATGDFNGDGKADILWKSDTGGVAMWQMDGNKIAVNQTVGSIPSASHVAATGDFNGDGKADILWKSDAGSIAEWQMDGTKITANQTIGSEGAGWHVAGTGDFNGDGKSDILWFNDNGSVATWQMNGTQVAAGQMVGSMGAGWHVAGTGDFNGDGKSDILWFNDNGSVAMWQMDGNNIAANQTVGSMGAGWHVADIGDYNHDGHSDILWHNDNGAVAVWEMDGAHILANHSVGTVSSDWHLA